MTTGRGMFAPFAETADFYYPETELAIFVLIDEDATDIDRMTTALCRIGTVGFGRNASTGCGRFSLAKSTEKAWSPKAEADACYTLAPAIPEKGLYKDGWFTPFTRFGRHGDALAVSKIPLRIRSSWPTRAPFSFRRIEMCFPNSISAARRSTYPKCFPGLSHKGIPFIFHSNWRIENG